MKDHERYPEGGDRSHRKPDQRDEVWSKVLRVGKRTYFFDVKTTKANDHYLTITESKKKFSHDGRPFYEKHKLFLYKEDFEQFRDSLTETIDKVSELQGDGYRKRTNTYKNDVFSHRSEPGTYENETASHHPDETSAAPEPHEIKLSDSFSNLNFDDLGKSD